MQRIFTGIASSLFIFAACTFSAHATPITFDRTLSATVTQVEISFLREPFQLDIPLGTPVTLSFGFTGEPIANPDGTLTLRGRQFIDSNNLTISLFMPIAFDAPELGPRQISDGTDGGFASVVVFPDGTFTLQANFLDGQPGFDTAPLSLSRDGEITFSSFENVGLAGINITAQVPEALSTLWSALPISLLLLTHQKVAAGGRRAWRALCVR